MIEIKKGYDSNHEQTSSEPKEKIHKYLYNKIICGWNRLFPYNDLKLKKEASKDVPYPSNERF